MEVGVGVGVGGGEEAVEQDDEPKHDDTAHGKQADSLHMSM